MAYQCEAFNLSTTPFNTRKRSSFNDSSDAGSGEGRSWEKTEDAREMRGR